MSIREGQLIQIKNDLNREAKGGVTSVRIRNDVHKMAKEEAEKQNKSIVNYVTLAVIEKMLREIEM
tara:strand:- start:150 stop:347 length:198 start_codon:yes stop_codon:yes gene_type:complete